MQGDIAFTGDLGDGGSLDVETHSGDVAILLPPDTEAELSLTTFEGLIESEFGSGVTRPANGEPRITFATGAGGDVVVRSFSGSITLRKDARLARRGS